jgi:hypothetical protein
MSPQSGICSVIAIGLELPLSPKHHGSSFMFPCLLYSSSTFSTLLFVKTIQRSQIIFPFQISIGIKIPKMSDNPMFQQQTLNRHL